MDNEQYYPSYIRNTKMSIKGKGRETRPRPLVWITPFMQRVWQADAPDSVVCSSQVVHQPHGQCFCASGCSRRLRYLADQE